MTKTCWEMWALESKLLTLLLSLATGSSSKHCQYVLNLQVIWQLQKDKKLLLFNLLGSLFFQAAIIKNIKDWLLTTSVSEKSDKQITMHGLFICFCVFHCLCMHVLACVVARPQLARLRLLLVMGDIDFFFLPPLFSLGFWQNHSTMETKKLLCDRGKPFISAAVNGGLLLITAWVITHKHTHIHTYRNIHKHTHTHTGKEPQSTHI